MKNVIAYARVPVNEQNSNLEDQILQITNYCKRNKKVVTNFYSDISSGVHFNRPAFNQFLGDIKSETIKVDELIVCTLSVFSRNINDCTLMVKSLKNLGVDVFSITEGRIESADEYDSLLHPFFFRVKY